MSRTPKIRLSPRARRARTPAEEEARFRRGLHQQERVVRDEIDEVAHSPT